MSYRKLAHTALVCIALVEQIRSAAVECRFEPSLNTIVTDMCVCYPCHLCEMELFKGCQLKTENAITVSDGSDVQARQPTLDASKWFLSKDEITNSRGGIERTDMHVYSSGNLVHIFPDTSDAFKSMYDGIISKETTDIFYTSWGIDNIPYIPQIDPSQTYKTVWTDAIRQGKAVHGLVWENLENFENVTSLFTSMKPLSSTHPDFQMVLDNRVLPFIGSIHQKTMVFKRMDDSMVSYIGGLDHASDRWDTKYHNESELRKKTNITNSYNGWIDVHTKIMGPASSDILANFLDRWNDPEPPRPLIEKKSLLALASSRNTSWNDPRPIEFEPSTTAGSSHSADSIKANTAGPHSVQILRTYSCIYKGYGSFAPHGETSILAGQIKAIRQAKNYIYIEDQYFVHVPDLQAELLKILPTIQRLIVVTPTRGGNSKKVGFEKYLFDMVSPLQKQFPGKVFVYRPKPDLKVYVHSKALLIDDVYISIGSANWNVRSMTADAEIGAQIVDTTLMQEPKTNITITKLAHDFRVAKFAELTRFSIDFSQMSFMDASNALDAYAQTDSAFIETFEIYEKVYFHLYPDIVQAFFDGDGRCFNNLASSQTCTNSTWLDTQSEIVKTACSCIMDNDSIDSCPAMSKFLEMEQAFGKVLSK
jgi:phosphatidylserine/phosphatidylglycerophosphate/cardiolipin synthase-like enzyme